MNIAITGGAGFIGTRLRALLEQAGHRCVVIDRADSQNPVDILDLPALTSATKGCDAIYHLAAEHRDDVSPRQRYYDVNVSGSENVTKAADANGIKRVIFTSSFAVYGLDAKTPDENTKPAPFNDYGQSKLEGEGVLQAWAAKDTAINLTIVRPVVVFGEGNRGNVHTLVEQVCAGKFVMVGDGRNHKSVSYVGNTSAFLAFLLAREEKGEVFNYADSPDFSMNELMAVIYKKLGKAPPSFALPFPVGLSAGYTFDILARVTGKTFPISSVRIRKFCADTTCNAQKARRAGFVPPFTLEEGISRTIAFDFKNDIAKAA